MNIAPIEGIKVGDVIKLPEKTGSTSETGFGDRFKQAISQVNTLQHEADQSMADVSLGKIDIHEGMMALGRASMSLRLLVTVRSKILDAYKEISRM